MKRFTNRYSNGKAFIMNCTLQTTNGIEDVIEKLAYYEDLEEDGRLIRLPCKVEDKIWIPFIGGDIAGLRVQSVTIGPTGKVILNLNDYPLNTVWGDEIGKTIYLSKEEAEKHLTDESKKYIM